MKLLHVTHVGMNKGKKRIWLEFEYLQLVGFEPGQLLNVQSNDESIEISVVDSEVASNKKVSRRGDKPLIEIPEKLIHFAEHIQKLRLAFTSRKVTITPHKCYQRRESRVERLVDKVQNGEPLDLMTLFSGGEVFGCAAYEGLKSSSIKSRIAVCVEKETKFLKSSLRNNQHLFDHKSILINAKIQDLDFEAVGMPMDGAIVSIPCQAASIAGRTKNKLKNAEDHSEVGHLFHYALNWLAKVNVPFIMFECVPQYVNTPSMSVIRNVLSDDGYTLIETVQNGQDFGSLENRSRMIAIAFSNELVKCFGGFATEITDYFRAVEHCVGDILEEIEDTSPRWKPFKYLIDKEKRDIEAGKGFRRVIALREATKIPVIGFDYAKCRSNEPFVLKDESDTAGLSRIFTSSEHALIKKIPHKIVDGLSETVAHQVLGQSGIYTKIRSVFEWLGKQLYSHFGKNAVLA
ncbi:DNA cytosine methyltransferase [Vibrio alginolyticus]|uniref:DNA cytosine methyltransferase n=1 Tax=Vibrio alginolyticus TaxID=663 RepID=UPI00375015D9|nr:DNA cytosine methyltransferase [Vibrio parahaemolyticus]HCG9204357.1 DNA cytosine methyltransferase [Vibrio parahaemolyticus]